ncbi:MAG: glycosyltransferase, partial [Deltaproteobacteria bacterium]|nr:glycosyltransferase [Deltaproteobacteria bacterium]
MPTAIDLIPAAFCLAALVTPYLLYPLVVRYGVRPRARGEAREPGPSPSVSVLIPAHNEAARLDEKLLNTLRLAYPSELLEILVASDGSADATASIARAYEDDGVRVFELTERGGKLAALTHLLAHARGELILFTDVGASLQTDMLRQLVRD